jgi:hypothetical protein
MPIFSFVDLFLKLKLLCIIEAKSWSEHGTNVYDMPMTAHFEMNSSSIWLSKPRPFVMALSKLCLSLIEIPVTYRFPMGS